MRSNFSRQEDKAEHTKDECEEQHRKVQNLERELDELAENAKELEQELVQANGNWECRQREVEH